MSNLGMAGTPAQEWAPWAPFLQAPRFWFALCAGLGGYLLVMFTNPARGIFRDGFRAVRRHRQLWGWLALFGFGYAVFQLALRIFYAFALPPGQRPVFQWGRAWFLPHTRALEILGQCALTTAESVAGIFNAFVTTFPLAALFALLFLLNHAGHRVVLRQALQKRFGAAGWFIHGAILLCAFSALLKPLLYLFTPFLGDRVPNFLLAASLLDCAAFFFEYLFGVCIQIYLILLVYLWVRGRTFTHQHLVDFAIRRFSYVVKWAAIVLAISTVLIRLPLIVAQLLPLEMRATTDAIYAAIDSWIRPALAAFLILFGSVQITLTFHSESCRRAVRDHFRFVRRHGVIVTWFLIIAAIHFFLVHAASALLVEGFGDGTAAMLVWQLISPTITALVGGWLLASWVCLFKRCETGAAQAENWITY